MAFCSQFWLLKEEQKNNLLYIFIQRLQCFNSLIDVVYCCMLRQFVLQNYKVGFSQTNII